MIAVSESAVGFESLWFIGGVSKELVLIAGVSKELTSSFFPRINFQSETRILLYPTVPVLILNSMLPNVFPDTVIDLTRCVTKSLLVMFYVFLNIYPAIYNILKIIQKS